MDTTFYDSSGRPVAYSEDGEQIYTFDGEPVAYIQEGSVWSMDGKHLGRFEEGWIRDNHGECVFFTERASGGPMKPMREMKPMKSMKSMKPMKGMREMRPMRPMKALGWSKLSDDGFFG